MSGKSNGNAKNRNSIPKIPTRFSPRKSNANGPSKSISPSARANDAVAKGLPNNFSTYYNSYLYCRITSMFHFLKISYLQLVLMSRPNGTI